MKSAVWVLCMIAASALGFADRGDRPRYNGVMVSKSFDDCPPGPLDCPGVDGSGEIVLSGARPVLILEETRRDSLLLPQLVEVESGGPVVIQVTLRAENLQSSIELAASGAASGSVTGVSGTSSWHKLQLTLPSSSRGNLDVYLRFSASAKDPGVGRLYVDGIEVVRQDTEAADAVLPISVFTNPCPEGEFADLGHPNGDCLPLDVGLGDIPPLVREFLESSLHVTTGVILSGRPDTPLGFDLEHFKYYFPRQSENIVYTASCRQQEIQSAVDAVNSGGGGTVRLPACTEPLESSVRIIGASNLILEGSGIGVSVLERPFGGWAGPLIDIRNSENVVVRDLSFHMNDVRFSHLAVNSSSNVLFERVAIQDNASPGIRVQHTSRLTIRYSVFDRGDTSINDPGCQNGWFEGPPPDKHDLDGDRKGSTYECEEAWKDVDYSPGQIWSASYAIYSNVSRDNAFSLHSTLGEIAGNQFIRSRGNKLADGQLWWIHHNEFSGTDGTESARPSFWTTTDEIVDRNSNNNLIYRNRFFDLTNPALRLHDGQNIYVFANYFSTDQPPPKLGGSNVVICPFSQETAWVESGIPGVGRPVIADDRIANPCNLARPGTFWQYANVSSGPPKKDK